MHRRGFAGTCLRIVAENKGQSGIWRRTRRPVERPEAMVLICLNRSPHDLKKLVG
jgi:hypothetical protein